MNLAIDFRKLRNSILKPHIKKTVIEVVSEHRQLKIGESAKPGKWQPFVKLAIEPMNAVTTIGVRYITLMMPAQVMKTDFLLNVIFYFVQQDPSAMILAMPIDKLAEAFSKDRVDPMINSNKALSSLIKGKRERDSENNLMLKKFSNGASLSIVSAASVSDVASRTARIVMMDELDRFKDFGEEGDPEKLLNERTNTHSHNSLDIAVSTPTNAKTSRIKNRFDISSQGFFHAVCPHCDTPQRLYWENVKWDEDKPETAGYVCSDCSVVWSEPDRHKAIKAGYYIFKDPSNKSHLGFQANAIASPWQTLAALVKKFLDCKGKPNKLRTFVNLSLAEIWTPKVDVPEWERLYERREKYASGIIPNKKILFLTAGVDIQKNRIEMAVYGYTRTKESYLIEALVFDGDTNTDEPWNELKKAVAKEYGVIDSKVKIPISMTCVDSGYNTSKVYDWVVQFNPNKVRPVKGSDSLLINYSAGKIIQPTFTGVKSVYSHMLYTVGSSIIKEAIYSFLKLNAPVDGAEYPSNYLHINEQESEFFKQLTAEAQTQKKGKYEWVKVRDRNEQLDMKVYSQAAAQMYGLSRFSNVEWDILEKRLDEANDPEIKNQTKIIQQKNQPVRQNNTPWKHQALNRNRHR